MTPSDTPVEYESQTVRALRGLESRTISKWEKEGWEVVSQAPGALWTDISLRRPAPALRWRRYALLGAVVAVVSIILIVNGIAHGGKSAPASQPEAQATSTPPAAPSTLPSIGPSPATPDSSASATITAQSDPEFAAILALGDYCDASIATFASEHKGQTIMFDGNVAAMSPSGANRLDLLLGADDYSETKTIGPAFQFEDVNPDSDLHVAGAAPLVVGANVRVTARVDEYKQASCLLKLTPIATALR